MSETCKILVCDLVGLKFDATGNPDLSEVRAYIELKGGVFHTANGDEPVAGKLNFYYLPDLSTEDEILALTDQAQFDAVIAAATLLPIKAVFPKGAVRIGAGTGNMRCECFGTVSPLMNTPGFNSRATAQMAMKALLRVRPDLPVAALHTLSVAGLFDTGRHLRDYPTAKLEGQSIGIVGYGNIGRELAKLTKAFGMHVKVYAREHHKLRIESDGFTHAATPVAAADGVDVLSVHIGLGTGGSNAGFVGDNLFSSMNHNAVLINYDRGECVDVQALDRAMDQGVIGNACIDADIFINPDGSLRGPLVPYLSLEKKYPGRFELLPHAAADTDHPSRVAGAKQAVDQIFDCILNKRVTNLVGQLPSGYVDAGSKNGV
jgi:lactate dehydrogenase-like 2-hydroxyacid dehydrogenase